MKLAKPCVDVALFTDRADPAPMLAHWQQRVGLPFEEPLAVGGGTMQHRHALRGSVLKLNHSRRALPDVPPSGYRELWIAREDGGPDETLADPDGNVVRLVPPGTDGVSQIAVVVHARRREDFERWFGRVLGFDEVERGVFACAETRFVIEDDPGVAVPAAFPGPGYRYLTVQVWDCDAEHAGLLARGAEEAAPPRTLGDVARFSMVKDPDGNWIEISQRASLTGPLPQNDG